MQIPTGPAKILVLGVLELVCRRLRGLGYEVTAVATGHEALHLLSINDGFDLLFTDVVMPNGVNGVELARRARRAFGPELKILFTSGYPAEVFEETGRPDPDISLLKKPYRLADLATAVSGALSTPVRVS